MKLRRWIGAIGMVGITASVTYIWFFVSPSHVIYTKDIYYYLADILTMVFTASSLSAELQMMANKYEIVPPTVTLTSFALMIFFINLTSYTGELSVSTVPDYVFIDFCFLLLQPLVAVINIVYCLVQDNGQEEKQESYI